MRKKIAFIGNVDNCTYWYAKFLQEIGIDAYLYAEFKKYNRQGQPAPAFRGDPRIEDKSLGKELPRWVKFYHIYSLGNLFNINREFSQYDLNIAFARLPILIQFCKKPLISFATGNDMRGWIFKPRIGPMLLRRALKKSKMVLFDNVDMDTLETLNKLGIKNYEWIPDYADKDCLLGMSAESMMKDDFLNQFKEKFICFSPSRPIFQIKGTDILVRSFTNFVKKNKGLARLLIADRDGDGAETEKLIKKLGIRESITILSQISKGDVVKLMQNSSVIFGYFKDEKSGVHHFPLVIQDALALGNIIISSIDTRAFQKVIGEEPPVLKAFNEKDVENQLKFVFNNYEKVKKEASIAGPAWIKKYHSKEFIRQKLIKIIEKYADQT